MDLPDAALLERYWSRHPPTHLLVAGAIGWKGPRAQVMTDVSGEQARKLRLQIERQMRGEVN